MEEFEILEIAQKFEKLRRKAKCQSPYNVFAAWKMSENDHTKLLLSLLRYQDPYGRMPLLTSFLNNFAKGRDKMIHYQHPKDVDIRFNPKYERDAQHSFIDGLVIFTAGGKRIAVIIENKIYDAPDQPAQIRRYITHMTDTENVALDNVWVFYVTGNGMKEIDDTSYNIRYESKSTNIGRRFVMLNYASDIVGWLKENVLNARIYPESLTCVVRTYVEFLEKDLFCEDHSDARRKDMLCNTLIGHHNLKKLTEADITRLYAFFEDIARLKREKNGRLGDRDLDAVYNLYRLTQDVIRDVEELAFGRIERCSAMILNNWWKKELKKGGFVWTVAHRGTRGGKKGFIQIRCVEEWGSEHLEWCQVSTSDMFNSCHYVIELHIEGDKQLAEQWQARVWDNATLLPPDSQKTKNGTSRIFRLPVATEEPLAKLSLQQLEKFLTKLYTEDLNVLLRMLLENANTCSRRTE